MTTTIDFIKNIGLIDDTEVAVDAKGYVGQSNPAPAAPGTYGFKIRSLDFKTDNEGNPVVKAGINARGQKVVYPVFTLEQVEIVEPEENKRLVMLYQDLSTKPFQRMAGRNASQAGDFVRAFDTTSTLTTQELVEEILALQSKGLVFYADLDWKAADWGYVADRIEELNLRRDDPEDQAKINDLYRNAQQIGWYKFRDAEGHVSHLWEGPSGSVIEARAYIKKFHEASKPPKTLGVARGFAPF